MKLLVVEDDAELVDYLRRQFKAAGYVVEWAADGIDGEFLGLEIDFDAIVLDLGLPEKPGLEVLRHWRAQQLKTPVLVLTARDSWKERVDGLKAGADDYLGKPFHFEELQARLEAILRRKYDHNSSLLQYHGLQLNPETQAVTTSAGMTIQLTAIEFRLLRYLMLKPDKIISKTELSEHVYEDEQIKDSNVIEVYINRLRAHLGKSSIKNFRGQGYRLSPPTQG